MTINYYKSFTVFRLGKFQAHQILKNNFKYTHIFKRQFSIVNSLEKLNYNFCFFLTIYEKTIQKENETKLLFTMFDDILQ